MKEIDFRVGDKVFSLPLGNGIIQEIIPNMPTGIYFRVVFENSNEYKRYTTGGKINKYDKHRSLFHGHNLEITVKEKLPVRTVSKWVYLYISNFGVEVSNLHDSKEYCAKMIEMSTRNIVSGPIEIKLPEEN